MAKKIVIKECRGCPDLETCKKWVWKCGQMGVEVKDIYKIASFCPLPDDEEKP